MLTKKIAEFSDDLLNAVKGVLGEAKKCEDCGCAKCECEEVEEGYVPTADEPSDKDKKTADKVRALLAKEKKPVKPRPGRQRVNVEAALNDMHAKLPKTFEYLETDLKKRKKNNDKAIKDMKKMGSPMKNPAFGEEVELEEGKMKDLVTKHMDAGHDYETALKKAKKQLANESFEQIDELSVGKLSKYISATHQKGKEEKKKRAKGLATAVDKMSYPKGSPLAKKVPATEEVEQIEEASKPEYHYYATTVMGPGKQEGRKLLHPKNRHFYSERDAFVTIKSRHNGEGTIHKVHAKTGKIVSHRTVHGGEAAYENTPEAGQPTHKSHFVESVEQIDEISKKTLGSYIKKASGHAAGSAAATAAIASSSNPKVPEKVKRDLRNRLTGISKATDKLTKEEQDFIDALNADTLEEGIASMSDARLKYHATKDLPHGRYTPKEIKAEHERRRKSVPNYHAVKASLNEARGRPKKAGAKDFTIHPKTKEKLMHNNPEHMAKIEKLQKHGVLPKPKTEAAQHIINQLQKAKTSMTGGATIHFTHGDSKHVSGTHAAKVLDKYAGMKPNEKEDFQKKIGHSHEQLMKHV